MNDLIPFKDRLRQLLKEKNISSYAFESETGIARRILYDTHRKTHKSTLMAIAYYMDMSLEELVEGTTAMYFI